LTSLDLMKSENLLFKDHEDLLMCHHGDFTCYI